MAEVGDQEFPGHGLAAALRGARELAGMSRAELAVAAGISVAVIMKAEVGDTDPRWSTILKLHDALKAIGILFEFQVSTISFAFRRTSEPRPKWSYSSQGRPQGSVGLASDRAPNPVRVPAQGKDTVGMKGAKSPDGKPRLLMPFPPYKGS